MENTQEKVITSAFQENVAFTENSTILIWKNSLDLSYAPHWHNAMEVIIPVENYYDVTTSSNNFHLQQGDILIIPPGEIHSLFPPDRKDGLGLRYIYLIDISFLAKIKGFAILKTLMSQPLHITQADYGNLHKKLLNLFMDIEKEYFDNKEFCEISIYSILLKIFAQLGYNRTNSRALFSNIKSHKKAEYIQKLNIVLDYIDANYMDEINIDGMAKMAGFSKYHFSRLFTEYTKYSFCEYINFRRIQAAAVLLSNDALSITEIALQSGFSSIPTFNRLFKRFNNCSPSEYRNYKL